MRRKAAAGQVTGGRVFGYDNLEVLDTKGDRSHVERRINEAEAAVVRRMFELCADGAGLTRITKTLNAEGVAAPRPQLGRPHAWATSSVRAVLRRPLYKGEIVWNRSRKRDRWGQQHQHARPEAEWMRTPAPALRIVPDDLWASAHAQLAGRVARFPGSRRTGDRDSRYLLSGLARCALCGGGFASHSRTHGKQVVRFYGCTSHWKRGPEVCSNGLVGRMNVIDAEVLATMKDDIFRASVVERAVALVLEELSPQRMDERHAEQAAALAAIDAEHAAVMAAITRGGDVELLVRLVGRLQALQGQRAALTNTRPARGAIGLHGAPEGLERRIREKLADWRGLLTRNMETGREVIKALLVGPLRFTPEIGEQRRRYRFTGAIALDRLLAGVIDLKTLTGGTSPEGFVNRWRPPFDGFSDLRAA